MDVIVSAAVLLGVLGHCVRVVYGHWAGKMVCKGCPWSGRCRQRRRK